jgi:ABC-type sugar transport system substrate-binding protein
MKKSLRTIAGLGLASMLVLSACGSSGPTAGSGSGGADQIKLGFISKYSNDYFQAMQDAVKQWDDANPNVTVITGQGSSENDVDGQIAVIESMVTQQVKGIAIAPIGEGVQPALEAAAAKGIKIVLVDNDLAKFTQKTAVVSTDNHAGGVLAGKWLATQLKPNQTVAVLAGTPGVPALDDRVNGMIEGLGAGFDVVQTVATECTREKGVSGTEDILAAHPDVAAIYAACGPPALGAIEALANKNVADDALLLVGFDALPDEAKQILAGKEDATVGQFPKKMGSTSLDTLVTAINGGTVKAAVDTGTVMVTTDNAQQFTTFQ